MVINLKVCLFVIVVVPFRQLDIVYQVYHNCTLSGYGPVRTAGSTTLVSRLHRCTTRPAEATPKIFGVIEIYVRGIRPRQNGTHHRI